MNPFNVIEGDALERLRELPAESVQTVVTSPPYWGLRDYGVDGQIGLEETPRAFVERLVEVFREVRRVLRSDPFAGTATTGIVALKEGRKFIGIELNPTYAEMARERSRGVQNAFGFFGGPPR